MDLKFVLHFGLNNLYNLQDLSFTTYKKYYLWNLLIHLCIEIYLAVELANSTCIFVFL